MNKLTSNKIIFIHLILSFFILILSWYFSISKSPYADIYKPCDVINSEKIGLAIRDWSDDQWREFPCGYSASTDHWHFKATYHMLNRENVDKWGWSVVLRRILFPVIAYPFMKLLGYEFGGAVCSLFIHLATIFLFVKFIKSKIGIEASLFCIWILVTFPGIPYFAGLPYSYTFIFPGSLISFMLIWEIAETNDLKKQFIISFLLGIVFLGYDFLVIFGLALFLLKIIQKSFKSLIVIIPAILLPQILLNLILKVFFEIPVSNSNSAIYSTIALSYFGIFQPLFSSLFNISPDSPLGIYLNENAPFPNLEEWGRLVMNFPVYAFNIYLFSTFLFLPLLFIVFFVLNLFWKKQKFNLAILSVIVSVFILFCFNNLAPPYKTWQVRGLDFARIYEPVFVALLVFSAIKFQQTWTEKPKWRYLFISILIPVIIGNCIVSFGTIFPTTLSREINRRFYYSKFQEEQINQIIKEYLEKNPQK